MKKKKLYQYSLLTIALVIIIYPVIFHYLKQDIEHGVNQLKEPVTLRFMDYIQNEELQETWIQLIDEFNRTHPNIHVKLEIYPWENYLDKLKVLASADMLPDVAKFKSMWLPAFEKKGILTPLDEYVDKWKYKDDLNDLLLPSYRRITSNGKLYMLPSHLVASYITYRKDLFDEAGVEPPETMDEFLKVAKELTIDRDNDNVIDQYGYTMRTNSNGQGGWFSFIFADMKHPSFYQGDQFSFHLNEVVEANQWWIDLYRVHHVVDPNSSLKGTNANIEDLISGRSAMMTHHVQTSKKLKNALGEKFGVISMPVGKGGQRFSTLEEGSTVIFQNCKNKKEAFEFISWLIEPEQHKRLVKNGDTMVFLKSLMKQFEDDPVQKISMDSLKSGEFTIATPHMGEWTTQIWPSITSKALSGSLNSEEMLTELEFKMFDK